MSISPVPLTSIVHVWTITNHKPDFLAWSQRFKSHSVPSAPWHTGILLISLLIYYFCCRPSRDPSKRKLSLSDAGAQPVWRGPQRPRQRPLACPPPLGTQRTCGYKKETAGSCDPLWTQSLGRYDQSCVFQKLIATHKHNQSKNFNSLPRRLMKRESSSVALNQPFPL